MLDFTLSQQHLLVFMTILKQDIQLLVDVSQQTYRGQDEGEGCTLFSIAASN